MEDDDSQKDLNPENLKTGKGSSQMANYLFECRKIIYPCGPIFVLKMELT